ncbi:MAG: hypothetical protein HKO65_20405 [Gemmatimonadetes bacterium]|nr:hypothetical protein [Gemmatimonadota bacterium]NNM07464.1 hypothetical protein [Gemmatimonadota bacterium]
MENQPWWLRFMAEADPWVVVLGALLLFLLAQALVNRLFFKLAQHMTVGIKAVWEFLSNRQDS